MDPIQFGWEVAQSVFGLVTAVALPLLILWLIARHNAKNRSGRAGARRRSHKHRASLPDRER